MHEAQVAFLDEVRQKHAAPEVGLGNTHNHSQIVLNHALAGGKVASASGCKLELLLEREQLGQAHIEQIDCKRVARIARHLRDLRRGCKCRK